MRCLPAWLSLDTLGTPPSAGTKCEHEYKCAYECPPRVLIDHRAYRILCALRLFMTASWSCCGLTRCSAANLQLSLLLPPLLSFLNTGNLQLAQCLIALRHVSWHPQLVACNLRAVAKAQVYSTSGWQHGEGGGGGGRVIWWCSKHLYSRAPTGLQGNLLTYKGASCQCRRLFTVSLDLACHMPRLPRGAALQQQIPETVPAALPVWSRSNFGKIIQMLRCKM